MCLRNQKHLCIIPLGHYSIALCMHNLPMLCLAKPITVIWQTQTCLCPPVPSYALLAAPVHIDMPPPSCALLITLVPLLSCAFLQSLHHTSAHRHTFALLCFSPHQCKHNTENMCKLILLLPILLKYSDNKFQLLLVADCCVTVIVPEDSPLRTSSCSNNYTIQKFRFVCQAKFLYPPLFPKSPCIHFDSCADLKSFLLG